jgi:murein DD-endopeptidase MepM/ murein hydrolase activator NlpD
VRLVRQSAAAAAALALSASSIAFVGGTPAHSPNALAAVTEPPLIGFHLTRQVFPMRADPQYGDGLDAGRGHEGQDLFAPPGTPLVAVADGVVLETGNSGGRGNYISIYDPAAKRTYNYFHMLSPALAHPGQRVTVGQKVGELGCTGSCWGYHLHFELRAGRDPYGPVLDPAPFLHRLPPAPAG